MEFGLKKMENMELEALENFNFLLNKQYIYVEFGLKKMERMELEALENFIF